MPSVLVTFPIPSLMAKRISSSPRRLFASPIYVAQLHNLGRPSELDPADALHLRQKSHGGEWELTHKDTGEVDKLRVHGRLRAFVRRHADPGGAGCDGVYPVARLARLREGPLW